MNDAEIANEFRELQLGALERYSQREKTLD